LTRNNKQMTILSITISTADKKFFYITKSIEEGECKFTCHHFTFDADNHAEVTLDENGLIKSIAPCKKSSAIEHKNLSSSHSVESNTKKAELKFLKSSTSSIVIIDAESFLHRELQSNTPPLPSGEIEEKLILSIGELNADLEGLQLHVERLEAEPELL